MQTLDKDSRDNVQFAMNGKMLYKLSKYVYSEALIDGYISMAGMERERFLKELEKNKKSITNNARFSKIISSILIVFMNIMTIGALLELKNYFPSVTEQTFSYFLFAIASNTTITFAIQILFLFTYGMTTMLGIFGSTNAFKFLQTMPLNNHDISKLVLFTFFRTLNYQFLAILVSFPVIVAIVTQSILTTLVACLVSVFNLIFCMSLMVLVGNFMAKKVFNLDQPSKTKTILRMLVSVGYLLGAMTAGVIFNFVAEWITTLFMSSLSLGIDGSIINSILCFVFYPYSLAYLFGLSVFPLESIYLSQSWIIFIGFIVSTLIILRIFRKANRVLRGLTQDVVVKGTQTSGSQNQPILVVKTTPIRAIIKKDTTSIFRNFTSIIYFIMPLIFPLIGGLSIGEDFASPVLGLIDVSMYSLIYLAMSAIFLLMAVIGSETDSGNVMESLPIRQHDIFRAKQVLILVPLLVAQLFPFIKAFIIEGLDIQYILLHYSSIFFICFLTSELVLDLYARLFGKIRNYYTLQNLNPTRKVLKVIIGAIILQTITLLPLIVTWIISDYLSQDLTLFVIELVISVILLVSVRIFSVKMFK